jgi:class 3 adenylate cyclase
MSHRNSTLAILFADISQSTQLFEEYGNIQAREIVIKTLTIIMNIINENGGKVIKTIGDEVMCTFRDSKQAVHVACEMHKAVIEDLSLSLIEVSVKVGLHYGDVLVEKNDVFGDAVNVASRMVGLANPYQIITTRTVVDKLPEALRINTRFIDQVKLQGKQKEIDIFEVIWQEDASDLTITASQIQAGEKKSLETLVLIYRGKKIELGENYPQIRLGRGKKNNLIIHHRSVSRSHLSIEFRKGKFVLIDSSTNGTYINMDNGERIFARREEIHLHGHGLISLGKDVSNDDPEMIRYECRHQR